MLQEYNELILQNGKAKINNYVSNIITYNKLINLAKNKTNDYLFHHA